MKKYCDSIQRKIQLELTKSGRGYLRTGLKLFHKERTSSYPVIGPAIGNLATAIELMIKAFLAKNNLSLLFKDLPLELRILFECPETLPSDSLNLRRYDNELRSSAYKTLELDELIASFYVFFPEKKQALRPYFRLLSRCRNASVHFSLPSFQHYELERTAYLALTVLQTIDWGRYPPTVLYSLTKQDEQFLSKYNEERIERVRRKIEEAKEKAKRIEAKDISILVDSWEAYETECPICGCGGMLTGDTQIEADFDEDEGANPYLIFLADTFQCDGCGIRLDDMEELRLAGIEMVYDRDKDMARWTLEHEPPGLLDYFSE